MTNKHRAPEIWGGWDLLPSNLELFGQCVRGAAKDLVETGKLDYEWMASYDNRCENIRDGKEIPGQDITDDCFRNNVMKYHKYLIGRVGPEWTVYRSMPRNTYPADPAECIPASAGTWVVAFQTTEATKMKDFKKKVLPYILKHPDVHKIDYVRMRVISQWGNYDLPRLMP